MTLFHIYSLIILFLWLIFIFLIWPSYLPFYSPVGSYHPRFSLFFPYITIQTAFNSSFFPFSSFTLASLLDLDYPLLPIISWPRVFALLISRTIINIAAVLIGIRCFLCLSQGCEAISLGFPSFNVTILI